MVEYRGKVRIAAFLLSIILLLTGCQAKEMMQSDNVKDGSKQAQDELLEHMDVSVAIWGIQEGFDHPNAMQDAVFKELEEKFNVTIVPRGVTWNDYQEKNKRWAATDTLPDIFVDNLVLDNPALYHAWVAEGIIHDIPMDLSQYHNLDVLMSAPPVQAVKVDGKQYMIPRGSDPSAVVSGGNGIGRPVMYRKDWAKEAGYDEAPKTYDDMVEMIRAMMVNHPNAAGIVVNNSDYLGTLSLDILPEYSSINSWIYEGEQWIPCYASERIIPYLERLQDLYAEGILDPDFITQKDGDAIAKFMNGDACVSLGGQFYASEFMASNPDVEAFEDAFGFILPFEAEDGIAYIFSGTSFWWSETYISANVDSNKLERILMLLDYMYSAEYMSMVQNGIEGIDWEQHGEERVSLLRPEETINDKYPITMNIGWLASWGYGDTVISSDPAEAAYMRMRRETDRYERENMKPAPIQFDILLMDNAEKTSIAGLAGVFQNRANEIIVTGVDARAAWQQIMNDFDQRGLQEAIQSVTSQAKAEGIEP